LALIPTLLPSPLLEPRYFIVPYILLRLQVQPFDEAEAAVPSTSTSTSSHSSNQKGKPSKKSLIDWANYLPWIELAWYALINFATMYVFLYKERVVQMPAGEEVIRFMW
jgi:alpha-1,2-glucosyltransferase